MRSKWLWGLTSFAPLVMGLATQKSTAVIPAPSYATAIAPIFRSSCIRCHSPEKRMGGLDLSTPAGILAGGVSGPAITPGNPATSLLVARIQGTDGKPRMPMGFPPLTTAQARLIFDWIKAGAPFEPASRSYAADVEPVLKAYCGPCHFGEDSRAGLRLDSMDGFKKGGVSGALVVPGDPDRSLLIRRLTGAGGLARMPMGFAAVDPQKIEGIRQWIAQGASYSANTVALHWAYRPISRPPVPATRMKNWATNPIDDFILARLEKEGLRPSPTADRETLIRRVYLDLIGLPPTPKEVDEFLADKRPDAYARVVDRLMANPHYGEKRAQKWLDLARYADSNGYEKDGNRVAWLYRDWLIDAFNRNVPYDRFTIEQLAGDLIPNATIEQLVATGFHRNTMLNLEGGVDPDEAMFQTIVDRVGTTSTVWLGQTLACAQCHDHKFDPITQKDFYRMYAFFNSNVWEERGDKRVSEMKYFETELRLPTAEQKLRLAAIDKRLKVLETSGDPMAYGRAWLADGGKNDRELAFMTPSFESTPRLTATPAEIGLIIDGPKSEQATYRVKQKVDAAFELNAFALLVMPDPKNPMGGLGRSSGGNFILSKARFLVNGKEVKISASAADFVQDGYSLEQVFDTDPNTGWAVYPQAREAHTAVFQLEQPRALRPGDQVEAVLECGSSAWPFHIFTHFLVVGTNARYPFSPALSKRLREILDNPKRTKAEADEFARKVADLDPSRSRVKREREALIKERDSIQQAAPIALVMKDKPGVRTLKAWVRTRGEFPSKAEEVEAGTPAFLPAMPSNAKADRLALAKWLINPKNPLAARVQANRMWEEFFGQGIVETSENFGTQGAAPSHPELLDWLASELMRLKWDMKALTKLIVTSNAYRQSSAATKELIEKDPANKLIARGPRFRLDAETIRDVALAASGILDPTIKGPSVFPDQPEGVWNSPYSGERWTTSEGGARYRRGLYTFWKRTSPYPSFLSFDATSRESCTVRRTRTNTPLQSLVLLNDPAFVRAAGGLVSRAQREGARSDAARIAYAFRLATSRRPSAAEKSRLLALLAQMRKRYSADKIAASKLGGTPEQAAWTMVGNVILNLDETISKG